MKALFYLIYKKIKNYFIDYRYNVSKLAILFIFIILIIFSFYSSKFNFVTRDISELYSLIFLFYLSTYIVGSVQGLRAGTAFFSKADMKYLFVSPIKSRLVLLYGILKQTGISFCIGLLLLLTLPWIKQIYNMTFANLVILLVCYLIVILTSNITAMAIYLFASDDTDKQKLVKNIIYIFCALIFIVILLPAIAKILTGKSILQAIVLASSAPVISLIPIAGWMQVLTISWIIKNNVMFIISIIPTIAYIFSAVIIILKLKSDYYEDVICRLEIKNNPQSAPSVEIIKKTGLKRGRKSSVFFYKQILENKRRGDLFFDKYSIFYILAAFIFALFTKDKTLAPLFIFTVLLSVFSTSPSRCVEEFNNHFIYLIPSGIFKKLIFICAENFLKTAAESTIIFLLAGLVMKASIANIIICIAARITFGILYITVRILCEKFIKANTNKIITIILYFSAFIMISIPGVIIGALLKNLYPIMYQPGFILIVSSIWNIFLSILIVYFCREMLSYQEL
ncbi:MAG: hypothetical protein GYA50_00545 [Eubacteriaceae bacterium]|nr:hypothetical protein [Eubacteriaceae bacterium]